MGEEKRRRSQFPLGKLLLLLLLLISQQIRSMPDILAAVFLIYALRLTQKKTHTLKENQNPNKKKGKKSLCKIYREYIAIVKCCLAWNSVLVLAFFVLPLLLSFAFHFAKLAKPS